MATFPASWVIDHPVSCCADTVGDGQLLDLFIKHQDESAFEELVRRHGRMVLGVCRRVLDNPHDAEDCFQAVFMVLVRKATTIVPREMVGNWLYGVAYRTALEAKKMAARRRIRERKKFDMPRDDKDTERWQELQPLLDQEMSRLPDKYRYVLIACDLEGRTRKEVAKSLALPEGTVASRLARARTMLAKRLTRRNLLISAGALAALLAERACADYLPPALVASTTDAAAKLTAGKPAATVISTKVAALMNAVVKSMLLAKLKIASAVVLALFMLAVGIGALLPSALAERKLDDPDFPVEKKKGKPISVDDCVLQKLDPVGMTIQATKLDIEGGADITFDLEVKPTTAILIDGKVARLADLQPHAYVNVEFQRGADGTNHAVRIEAIGAAFSGVVVAMNDNSVTIQPDKDRQKTYDLDPKAKVYVNGKKAKFGDLKVKMPVALRLSAGKPVVLGILAAGPKFAGVVKSFDGKTLRFGALAREVAPDALVLIDGKLARLADLRPGMAVTAQMSAETPRSLIVAIMTAK